jgi:hypothetical protein
VQLVCAGDAGELSHRSFADPWGAGTVTTVDATATSPALGLSKTVTATAAPGVVHMRARDYDPTVGALGWRWSGEGSPDRRTAERHARAWRQTWR